jgi:hypothetical protein
MDPDASRTNVVSMPQASASGEFGVMSGASAASTPSSAAGPPRVLSDYPSSRGSADFSALGEALGSSDLLGLGEALASSDLADLLGFGEALDSSEGSGTVTVLVSGDALCSSSATIAVLAAAGVPIPTCVAIGIDTAIDNAIRARIARFLEAAFQRGETGLSKYRSLPMLVILACSLFSRYQYRDIYSRLSLKSRKIG